MGSLRYAKSKGRTAEATVVQYLRDQGFNAERRRLTGTEDCGDVGGIAGLVIEVKDEKRINLAGYMDELHDEVVNAAGRMDEPDTTGFATIKRKGHPSDPGAWYAVMPLSTMTYLLKKAGYR